MMVVSVSGSKTHVWLFWEYFKKFLLVQVLLTTLLFICHDWHWQAPTWRTSNKHVQVTDIVGMDGYNSWHIYSLGLALGLALVEYGEVSLLYIWIPFSKL